MRKKEKSQYLRGPQNGSTEPAMKDSLPSVPSEVCEVEISSRIPEDVARLVAAQCLMFEKEIWYTKGRDPRFLREAASQLIGQDVDPYTYRIGDKSIAELIFEVNIYFHTEEKTPGASSFRQRVIQAQGGEYCALCGSRASELLHVDHVVPVNVGGQHHLSNMQLLCTDCNSAKGNLRSLGVAAILQLNTGSEISKLLRFKKLLESSDTTGGRTIGRCTCGRNAISAQLTVQKIRPLFAPTYLNLRVTCENH